MPHVSCYRSSGISILEETEEENKCTATITRTSRFGHCQSPGVRSMLVSLVSVPILPLKSLEPQSNWVNFWGHIQQQQRFRLNLPLQQAAGKAEWFTIKILVGSAFEGLFFLHCQHDAFPGLHIKNVCAKVAFNRFCKTKPIKVECPESSLFKPKSISVWIRIRERFFSLCFSKFSPGKKACAI